MTDESSLHHGPDRTKDYEDRFVEELTQRLIDGQNIALSVHSQVDKTDVIGNVLLRLRTREAYVAQVDVSKISYIDEFSRALIQSAIANKSGSSALESVNLEAPPEDEQADPIGLLEYAVSVPEFVARQDERRMIVVLDEFHELERLGGDELLKRLRAWFQCHVYTTYLFVSSQADLMMPLISQRQQAFYRFAVILECPYR